MPANNLITVIVPRKIRGISIQPPADPARIKLRDGPDIYGKALHAAVVGDKIHLRCRISATPIGSDAVTLVTDQVITGGEPLISRSGVLVGIDTRLGDGPATVAPSQAAIDGRQAVSRLNQLTH